MDKTEIILMITEGEKLDIRILKKLKSIFLPKKEVEVFPICLNIYNLYKKLSNNDDFGSEFIDVFSIIKEIIQEQPNSNNPEFLKLNRNQISEIFLFFDYDGHDTLASGYPNSIIDMLSLFDNETENGKLYINYPMVESYKHPINEREEIINILGNVHYKTNVAAICEKRIEQITRLNKDDWLKLFLPHLKSTNHLFNDVFSLINSYAESQKMSQSAIYDKQKNKYIDPSNNVMVLSSFSWFLLEYLGKNLFEEWRQIDLIME